MNVINSSTFDGFGLNRVRSQHNSLLVCAPWISSSHSYVTSYITGTWSHCCLHDLDSSCQDKDLPLEHFTKHKHVNKLRVHVRMNAQPWLRGRVIDICSLICGLASTHVRSAAAWRETLFKCLCRRVRCGGSWGTLPPQVIDTYRVGGNVQASKTLLSHWESYAYIYIYIYI